MAGSVDLTEHVWWQIWLTRVKDIMGKAVRILNSRERPRPLPKCSKMQEGRRIQDEENDWEWLGMSGNVLNIKNNFLSNFGPSLHKRFDTFSWIHISSFFFFFRSTVALWLKWKCGECYSEALYVFFCIERHAPWVGQFSLRFKPVTLPALLRQGACEFAWVNPKEEQRGMLGMGKPW